MSALQRLPLTCLTALLWQAALPAHAALPVGADAPDFKVAAALAGKEFPFSLRQALTKGPVVLYFYPKSFTSGCTVEAHAFAEASADFAALGASVIGVSNDDIATQKDFSRRECRDRFAVAADADASIIKRYDVGLALMPSMAARISFVIAPPGKIIYAYDSMNPDQHVSRTLAAVRDWRSKQSAAH